MQASVGDRLHVHGNCVGYPGQDAARSSRSREGGGAAIPGAVRRRAHQARVPWTGCGGRAGWQPLTSWSVSRAARLVARAPERWRAAVRLMRGGSASIGEREAPVKSVCKSFGMESELFAASRPGAASACTTSPENARGSPRARPGAGTGCCTCSCRTRPPGSRSWNWARAATRTCSRCWRNCCRRRQVAARARVPRARPVARAARVPGAVPGGPGPGRADGAGDVAIGRAGGPERRQSGQTGTNVFPRVAWGGEGTLRV